MSESARWWPRLTPLTMSAQRSTLLLHSHPQNVGWRWSSDLWRDQESTQHFVGLPAGPWSLVKVTLLLVLHNASSKKLPWWQQAALFDTSLGKCPTTFASFLSIGRRATAYLSWGACCFFVGICMIPFHHVEQLQLVSETDLTSLTHAEPNSTICSALTQVLGTIRFEATVGHCMFLPF